MENIRRKNKMIETYSILLIDLISVIISYALSLFIRFDLINEAYPKLYHSTVGAYIVVLCLLYSLFLDANRNFFYRGYFQEFYYTVRYTVILMVGLVLVLYLTQQAYDFSRLIYVIFAVINTIITYSVHMIFKKVMWKYYRKSTSSTKMMVITRDITSNEVVDRLVKGKEWYYDITSVAVYDADKKGTKIKDIP